MIVAYDFSFDTTAVLKTAAFHYPNVSVFRDLSENVCCYNVSFIPLSTLRENHEKVSIDD